MKFKKCKIYLFNEGQFLQFAFSVKRKDTYMANKILNALCYINNRHLERIKNMNKFTQIWQILCRTENIVSDRLEED